MTISTVTAFSGITDKAPASPAYFLSKFSEVYDNLNALNVAASGQSYSAFSASGRWHVAAFGAVGSTGTPTVDDSTAINNCYSHASNAGGGEVHFSGVSYNVLNVAVTPNTFTFLNGATLFKNTGAASTHVVEVRGTLSTSSATLTSGLSIVYSRATVGAVSSLATGNRVLIRDTQYVAGPTSGRNQELNSIDSLPGGRVGLRHPALSTYNVADSGELVVANVVNGALYGPGRLAVDATSGTSGGCLYMDLADSFLVQNVELIGPNDDAGLLIERSRRVSIHDCTIRDGQNLGTSGFGYGFLINESSHEILLDGVRTERCSDNLVSNGVQYVTLTNNYLFGQSGTGLDVHGRGCRHITLDGNVIVGSGAQGIAIGQSSLVSADFDVRVLNNQIYYAGGGGITVTGSATTRMQGIVVEGNRIYHPGNAGGGTYLGISGSRVSDLRIERNHVSAITTNVSAGIRTDNCSNVRIAQNIVDSVPGSGNGVRYQDCDLIDVVGNSFVSVAGAQVLAQNSNTSVRVMGNMGETTSVNLAASIASTVETGNWWGRRLNASIVTDGLAISPAHTFQSEQSLGFYRSAASTLALSYGTMALPLGTKLSFQTGANASFGTVQLGSNGSVNVATTVVTPNSVVFITTQADGGTIGTERVTGVRSGSGFTIESTNILDASIVAWWVIEPRP